jgi:hypothetical protein
VAVLNCGVHHFHNYRDPTTVKSPQPPQLQLPPYSHSHIHHLHPPTPSTQPPSTPATTTIHCSHNHSSHHQLQPHAHLPPPHAHLPDDRRPNGAVRSLASACLRFALHSYTHVSQHRIKMVKMVATKDEFDALLKEAG